MLLVPGTRTGYNRLMLCVWLSSPHGLDLVHEDFSLSCNPLTTARWGKSWGWHMEPGSPGMSKTGEPVHRWASGGERTICESRLQRVEDWGAQRQGVQERHYLEIQEGNPSSVTNNQGLYSREQGSGSRLAPREKKAGRGRKRELKVGLKCKEYPGGKRDDEGESREQKLDESPSIQTPISRQPGTS